MISPVLFYMMAISIVCAGLGAALSRNLFHSALYMLLTFAGVAGLYASMHEPFMAVVQILVYVGAITILVIFGIMLTNSHGIRMVTNDFGAHAVGGAVVSLGLFAVISVGIRALNLVEAPPIQGELVKFIGITLFGQHILATELAAVLLLVAMIGAVLISNRGEDKK